MRLLRLQDGNLSLIKFDKQIPSYAILSHTWGAAEDKVTFEDISRKEARSKKGYEKIKFCAEQAAIHSLEFFWVDTYYINKTDVQEFQNAINSIYRWYQNAKMCFVYMADLGTEGKELLAPREIKFYSNNNQFIGDKESLVQELEAITKIPASTILGANSAPFSLEECISWARDRKSTYEKDQAYSLLGLCGVLIAPNYGKGAKEAFERLRERCHKKRNKQRTTPFYKLEGKDNWQHDSQAHEALQLSRIDELSPFAQSHPNNFEETETGPLSKTTRRLVDIFDISFIAMRKFQDKAGHSLRQSIESEINTLQKYCAALSGSNSPFKTAENVKLYSSVINLLTSMQKKSIKSQGHSSRPTQSDSRSIRFRNQINHDAKHKLLVLCSLLMPGGVRVELGDIAARDKIEFLKSKS